MSTLPPLPPNIQAQLDQRLPDIERTLDAWIQGLRVDPKRDPNNLPDYHNTVAAMLIKAEQTIPGGPELNRHMAALAFIILADTGWAPENRDEDLPPIEDPARPFRRPKRTKRPRGKR